MKEHRDLTASAVYEPDPAAAAVARRFVRETLRSWELEEGSSRLIDDAVLLTSELVTNAIVHAGTSLQVSCRLCDGELEIAVQDRHPARAIRSEFAAADDTDRTNGRGLMLPGALASSWGVSYARTAKAVWFRIALREQPTDPGLPSYSAPQPGTGVIEATARAAADDDALAGIGRLGYDELLRRTVEMARDAVCAEAVYVLVADEAGQLRIRASAGIGAADLLSRLTVPGAQAGQMPRIMGRFGAFPDGLAQALVKRPAANSPAAGSLITVPFLAEGRVTGMLAAAAAEADKFTRAHSERLQKLADRVALSLERARLAELERARRGRLSFLAEASDLLAGTLDQHKTIALAAQLVVPRLASWCAVFLADSGRPEPAYVWHSDETRRDDLATLLGNARLPDDALSGGACQWSLAPASPSALPQGATDLAFDTVWCYPLIARGRALGAFVIGRPGGDGFPREVVEMVEDLARRAALAIDNARLYSQQAQTSQALQRSLLPPGVPHVPGLDLAVEYAAAGEGNEVGGDFYDVFGAAGNRWRFSIGDVCGTGPEAAAVTGLARYTMRILAREGRGIAAVLDRLNRMILDEGTRGRFLTLLHGEITTVARPGGRPPSGDSPVMRASLVCAGHPPPLLMRRGGKPEPAVSPQPLLGVVDDVTFRAKRVDLRSGDVLLCVTDGVTERRHGGRLLDDHDGLRDMFAACAGLNAGAVAARIMRAVRDFAPEPPVDDMALIVMRVL